MPCVKEAFMYGVKETGPEKSENDFNHPGLEIVTDLSEQLKFVSLKSFDETGLSWSSTNSRSTANKNKSKNENMHYDPEELRKSSHLLEHCVRNTDIVTKRTSNSTYKSFRNMKTKEDHSFDDDSVNMLYLNGQNWFIGKECSREKLYSLRDGLYIRDSQEYLKSWKENTEERELHADEVVQGYENRSSLATLPNLTVEGNLFPVGTSTPVVESTSKRIFKENSKISRQSKYLIKRKDFQLDSDSVIGSQSNEGLHDSPSQSAVRWNKDNNQNNISENNFVDHHESKGNVNSLRENNSKIKELFKGFKFQATSIPEELEVDVKQKKSENETLDCPEETSVRGGKHVRKGIKFAGSLDAQVSVNLNIREKVSSHRRSSFSEFSPEAFRSANELTEFQTKTTDQNLVIEKSDSESNKENMLWNKKNDDFSYDAIKKVSGNLDAIGRDFFALKSFQSSDISGSTKSVYESNKTKSILCGHSNKDKESSCSLNHHIPFDICSKNGVVQADQQRISTSETSNKQNYHSELSQNAQSQTSKEPPSSVPDCLDPSSTTSQSSLQTKSNSQSSCKSNNLVQPCPTSTSSSKFSNGDVVRGASEKRISHQIETVNSITGQNWASLANVNGIISSSPNEESEGVEGKNSTQRVSADQLNDPLSSSLSLKSKMSACHDKQIVADEQNCSSSKEMKLFNSDSECEAGYKFSLRNMEKDIKSGKINLEDLRKIIMLVNNDSNDYVIDLPQDHFKHCRGNDNKMENTLLQSVAPQQNMNIKYAKSEEVIPLQSHISIKDVETQQPHQRYMNKEMVNVNERFVATKVLPYKHFESNSLFYVRNPQPIYRTNLSEAVQSESSTKFRNISSENKETLSGTSETSKVKSIGDRLYQSPDGFHDSNRDENNKHNSNTDENNKGDSNTDENNKGDTNTDENNKGGTAEREETICQDSKGNINYSINYTAKELNGAKQVFDLDRNFNNENLSLSTNLHGSHQKHLLKRSQRNKTRGARSRNTDTHRKLEEAWNKFMESKRGEKEKHYMNVDISQEKMMTSGGKHGFISFKSPCDDTNSQLSNSHLIYSKRNANNYMEETTSSVVEDDNTIGSWGISNGRRHVVTKHKSAQTSLNHFQNEQNISNDQNCNRPDMHSHNLRKEKMESLCSVNLILNGSNKSSELKKADCCGDFKNLKHLFCKKYPLHGIFTPESSTTSLRLSSSLSSVLHPVFSSESSPSIFSGFVSFPRKFDAGTRDGNDAVFEVDGEPSLQECLIKRKPKFIESSKNRLIMIEERSRKKRDGALADGRMMKRNIEISKNKKNICKSSTDCRDNDPKINYRFCGSNNLALSETGRKEFHKTNNFRSTNIKSTSVTRNIKPVKCIATSGSSNVKKTNSSPTVSTCSASNLKPIPYLHNKPNLLQKKNERLKDCVMRSQKSTDDRNRKSTNSVTFEQKNNGFKQCMRKVARKDSRS